jgi:hypothetical protein
MTIKLACRLAAIVTNPSTRAGLRLLFQRRSFRWRSRVLQLKPRLWQKSLRRIPLFTNSATNLFNLRSRTSLGRRQLCFCGHPDTSTQPPPVEQVCWSDAYTRLANETAYGKARSDAAPKSVANKKGQTTSAASTIGPWKEPGPTVRTGQSAW